MAERRVPVADRLPGVLGRGHGAEQHVGMAGEMLGAGDHRHVGTEVQRLIEEARAPGVVDAERDAARLGQACQSRQVQHLECSSSGNLGIHGPRRWFQPPLDVAAVGLVDLTGDAHRLEHSAREAPRRLVGGLGDQAMVARAQERQQAEGDRRQARRRQPRAMAALEVGDHVLERMRDRRSAGAVGEFAVALVRTPPRLPLFGDALEQHGRGAIDRQVDGAPLAALRPARLRKTRSDGVLFVGHRLPIRCAECGRRSAQHRALQIAWIRQAENRARQS